MPINNAIENEINIMRNHLLELRKIAGWSAGELGQKLGLSRQAISILENKKAEMSQLHYLALIHLFESECVNNKDNLALPAVIHLLFDDPYYYQENKQKIDFSINNISKIEPGIDNKTASEILSILLGDFSELVLGKPISFPSVFSQKILALGKKSDKDALLLKRYYKCNTDSISPTIEGKAPKVVVKTVKKLTVPFSDKHL